jgi:hypothetical protein
MKAKPEKSTPSADVPVQYRPGPVLADLLDHLAGQWAVSRNEAAKRLAALAACQLDCRHADLVQTFAETLPGEPDFVHTCERLRAELLVIERTRKSLKQASMNEVERQEQLRQLVNVYVQQRQYRDVEEPEKAPRLREVRK